MKKNGLDLVIDTDIKIKLLYSFIQGQYLDNDKCSILMFLLYFIRSNLHLKNND